MLAGRLVVSRRELRMAEVPVPSPGPGEVLVKVEAAGVCLSDVHLIEGMFVPPLLKGDEVTLGHEVAGTVREIGEGVTGRRLGERVLLQAGEQRDGLIHTRGVDYDGGWAEYAVATASTVVPIPDDLSFEQACFIPDAVSTPWAAIVGTAAVRPAEAAGVWGVGGLGAHGVQLLRLVGAMPVIAVDPLPAARERALEFGADLALDSADPGLRGRIMEATGGHGLDAAFDFAGVPAVREQAVTCLARGTETLRGGRLVLVGLTDRPLTITDGTTFSAASQAVLGHYGSSAQHVVDLVKLVAGHRVEFSRSVSEVLPLAEAPRAVERLETKQGDPIRIVLRP
ncbi:MAG TPA: zinc-binding dehydrogenase [Thermomonospora sp.]|nr:zinc-binding dehydrogenase [Thermomonospora sp.]